MDKSEQLFAVADVPGLLVEDIRAFLGGLR